MKKMAGIFTAVSMLLAAMPVSAEMVPNYPLEHPGDATLYVHCEEDTEYTIEVLQTSPERKDLRLYGIAMTHKAGEVFDFPLEAGDYTIRVTAGATKDHLAPKTAETGFNVLNLDFTNAYEQAKIDLNLKFNHADSASSTPTCESDVEQVNEDGVETYRIKFDMTFPSYNLLRGDYTGDGNIKVEDAYKVLVIDTMRRTQLTPEVPPTAAQIAACDINNNGELDIHDSKAILDYAVASSINLPVKWKS